MKMREMGTFFRPGSNLHFFSRSCGGFDRFHKNAGQVDADFSISVEVWVGHRSTVEDREMLRSAEAQFNQLARNKIQMALECPRYHIKSSIEPSKSRRAIGSDSI
jgi:hypothetical protein